MEVEQSEGEREWYEIDCREANKEFVFNSSLIGNSVKPPAEEECLYLCFKDHSDRCVRIYRRRQKGNLDDETYFFLNFFKEELSIIPFGPFKDKFLYHKYRNPNLWAKHWRRIASLEDNRWNHLWSNELKELISV